MADVSEFIGRELPAATVVMERGPVTFFASAIKSKSKIYQQPSAASAAGFDNIPVPPTFSFAWSHMGEFPELQEAGAKDGAHPIAETLGVLMKTGGLILHGEQEFIYHRPIVVGDTLSSYGKISDIYSKDGSTGTMTFIVSETDWTDPDNEKVLTTKTTLIHRA